MTDLSSDTTNSGNALAEAKDIRPTALSTEYDESLRYSPRAAWSVVLLALLMVAAMAGWLELLHRADVMEQLGRAPETWSDRQVRDFATGLAYMHLGSIEEHDQWMLAVIEQRPAGEIAAAAASTLSWYGSWGVLSREERAKHGRMAAELVPTDSPMFKVYYNMYAMDVANQGKLGEAEAVLREGITRAATDEQRAALLERLLYIEKEHVSPEKALATYHQFATQHPDLVTRDYIRYTYADLLEAVGRTDEARSIWTDLAENAEKPLRREEARRRLAKMDGGESIGH